MPADFQDPRLKNFFRQLLHQAIHSAIRSIFWKLPVLWAVVILALLIGAVVYFQLY